MSAHAPPPFPLAQPSPAQAAAAAAGGDVDADTNQTSAHDAGTKLNPMKQAHLNSFLHQTTTVEFYASALKPLSQARRELAEATRALANLKKPHKGGKILPPSLTIDTLSKISLPKVGTIAPEVFFADELRDIKAAVATAEAAINALLIRGREKEVQHYSHAVATTTFRAAALETFRTACVEPYVTKFKLDPAVADIDFPTQAALDHFAGTLDVKISAMISDSISSSLAGDIKSKQRQEADAIAEESVLTGASTGSSIKQLAKQAVDENMQLKELKQQINMLTHTINSMRSPAHAAAASSAASDSSSAGTDAASAAVHTPRSKTARQQSRAQTPAQAMVPAPRANHSRGPTSASKQGVMPSTTPRGLVVTPKKAPADGSNAARFAPQSGAGTKRPYEGNTRRTNDTRDQPDTDNSHRAAAASTPRRPNVQEYQLSSAARKSHKPYMGSSPHSHSTYADHGDSDRRDARDHQGSRTYGDDRQRHSAAAHSTNSSGGDRTNHPYNRSNQDSSRPAAHRK